MNAPQTKVLSLDGASCCVVRVECFAGPTSVDPAGCWQKRSRVSGVVNLNVSKFTFHVLVNMLGRIGKPVRLAIG